MTENSKDFWKKGVVLLENLREPVCALLINLEFFLLLLLANTKTPVFELSAVILAALFASSSTIRGKGDFYLPSTWILGQITFFLCFFWHKKYLEIIKE